MDYSKLSNFGDSFELVACFAADFIEGMAFGDFNEGEFSSDFLEDGFFCDEHVDDSFSGFGESALLEDLVCSLGGVVHDDHDLAATRDLVSENGDGTVPDPWLLPCP